MVASEQVGLGTDWMNELRGMCIIDNDGIPGCRIVKGIMKIHRKFPKRKYHYDDIDLVTDGPRNGSLDHC
jgi:hypothetical protein